MTSFMFCLEVQRTLLGLDCFSTYLLFDNTNIGIAITFGFGLGDVEIYYSMVLVLDLKYI